MENRSNAIRTMTWSRGINSCNMIKTPSCYPRWQQYSTCLAAPAVTGKGHRKIEPKTKHSSHCKKNQSSWPNQINSSKRLAKTSNHAYKNSEKIQILFIDRLDHKLTIHRSKQTHRKNKITSNSSPRTSRRTLYWESKRDNKPPSY